MDLLMRKVFLRISFALGGVYFALGGVYFALGGVFFLQLHGLTEENSLA
jgi:hypothetical protein